MNASKVQGTPVTIPHLAESLVSATVAKWLRAPGDQVEQYDVLCELITDKVTVEMPSPIAGTITALVVKEGETADVGAAICYIAEENGAAVAAAPVKETVAVAAAAAQSEDTGMRSRYSPAVVRLASEHGIALERVQGTGMGGRVTRKDIEAMIENGTQPTATPTAAPTAVTAATPTAAPMAPEKPESAPLRSTGLHLSQQPGIPSIVPERDEHGNEYYLNVTPVRNIIASRMRQSVTEIPHAWTMIEVDVTNLVQLRNKVKEEFMRREGINITYLAFLLKAVVSAIKDYPIMNSVWGVDKIIVKRDINISLAVGTEDSVATPVIQKADQKNIAGLAKEIDELTKKGRTGKLSLSDMQGGTFTVNNTGSFGSILSNPIINYPQAAILTFESIVKKPVVIQDMIAVRSMVNLCLSLDHRILDGVICGRFLQRVKENLESYSLDTKLY